MGSESWFKNKSLKTKSLLLAIIVEVFLILFQLILYNQWTGDGLATAIVSFFTHPILFWTLRYPLGIIQYPIVIISNILLLWLIFALIGLFWRKIKRK